MKSRYRTVLVALVTAVSLSAVTANAAFATPEFEIKTGGVWSKVTSSHEVKITGEIGLIDAERAGGYACSHVEGTGTIEPKGIGSVKTFLLGSCVPKDDCASVQNILQKHLPWKTELYGSPGTRTRFTSGTEGSPAGSFRCNEPIGFWEDVCPMPTVSTSNFLVNGVTWVGLAFGTNEETTACTQDEFGSKKGHWSKLIYINPPTGSEAIRVS